MNAVIFYGGVALLLWSIYRAPGGNGRSRRGDRPRDRRRDQPDLPRLPLPDRRRRGHPRRAGLAGGRQRCIPGSADVAALALGVADPPARRYRTRSGGNQMTRALVIGRRRKGRHIGRTVRLGRERSCGPAVGRISTKMVTPQAGAPAGGRTGRGQGRRRGRRGRRRRSRRPGRLRPGRVEVELGIVPMGTGNLLAGNLDVPHGVHDATRVILGRPHAPDRPRPREDRRRPSTTSRSPAGSASTRR